MLSAEAVIDPLRVDSLDYVPSSIYISFMIVREISLHFHSCPDFTPSYVATKIMHFYFL